MYYSFEKIISRSSSLVGKKLLSPITCFFTIHYYLLLPKNPECANEVIVNSEEVISKNPERLRIRDFGDPSEIRTPDPLLKRQSPDSQGWGEPKTCCCSSTFRFSVFCVYVTRPTAYPVSYYNRKNGIRQTFLSINRHLILEINYSKAIFNRDDKMFRKTLLPDTNIFLTTAEALP